LNENHVYSSNHLRLIACSTSGYTVNVVCVKVKKRILTGDGTKASLYFLGFILSAPLKRMTFKHFKYDECLNSFPF